MAIHVYGFSDTLQQAYAGAFYLCVVYTDASTSVSLIVSKMKIALLKSMTVSRFELCGVLLLSKFLSSASNDLGISEADTYAWTDSSIVLNWLHTPPVKLKTLFVIK